MRTLDSDLAAAELARARYPLARLTVRDMRLRFAPFTTTTNPFGVLDTSQRYSNNYVFGDAVSASDGSIWRAWADFTGHLFVQHITTPADPAQWSHATNPWTDLGISPNSQESALGNCGLVAVGTGCRLFYDNIDLGGGGIGLHYRDSTDFSSDHFTSLDIFGTLCYAPVSPTELFGYATDWLGRPQLLGLVHIVYNGSAWVYDEAPYRLNSDKNHFVYQGEYNTITYFDAFVLNGTNHLVFSFGDAGLTYSASYYNGIWSEPRLLIPADNTQFVAYRASVLGSRAFLTGRLTRANDPDYSPAWDCYLMTEDGTNWSALARDSYLCQAETRGKLLLSGAGLYYAGLANVYRAPATYRVGADPVDKKLVVTEALAGLGLSFPAAGLAPVADIDLKNDDDAFTGSSVVQDGSEVWVEAGYKTAAGDRYTELAHVSLDSVQATQADGQRQLQLSGRSVSTKSLHDWTSPFYWTFPSQLRYFDPCDNANTLKVQRGVWDADSQNLWPNPSFETDTAGFTDTNTGAAAGTNARTSDKAELGKWSYRLVKTGGAADDWWGTHVYFDGLAGATYKISADLLVTEIAGGATEYTLMARGAGMGPNGTDLKVFATGTDTTLAFTTINIEVPVVAAGTLRIDVIFSNAATGTLYLDNFVIVHEAIGALSYLDQSEKAGLLVSTTPFAAGDFDLQAQFTFSYTVAARNIWMGLIGQYVDDNNYNALILDTHLTPQRVYLVAIRGAVLTTLAYATLTLAEGTPYLLRLMHQGGHFWAYFKAASAADWILPILEFRWGDYPSAQMMLCNTQDGTGSVGVIAWINAYKFLAAAADEASTTITVEQTGDFAAFPSAGTVTWELEQIAYTGKGTSSLTGCTRGYNGTSAAPHSAGLAVRLFTDEQVQLDNWQVSDTEPNYTTESLIQRVCAVAGAFKTEFADLYPRPGTADPASVFIPANADFGLHWLPTAIDTKNLDLTFDWTSASWGTADTFAGVGVLVRAEAESYATAHAYLIHLGYLAATPDLYWAAVYYLDGTGTTSVIDEFRLHQVPTGTGPHHMRVVVRDDWLAIYCDDALMGTFHDTRLAGQAHNYVALIAQGGDTNFDNVRIPELFEWRDTAWIDNDSVAQSTLDQVIIDDRPIYLVPRQNDVLKFSLFDHRDTVAGPEEDGSFKDLVYSDQSTTQDSDLISMLRLYAVTILEQLDPALAARSGFLFAARQMPRAENLAAASYFPRIFRRSQEVHGARSEEMPANLALEIEDVFHVKATPAGSSIEIDQQLIANDIEYTYQPANFTMKIGIRTRQA